MKEFESKTKFGPSLVVLNMLWHVELFKIGKSTCLRIFVGFDAF